MNHLEITERTPSIWRGTAGLEGRFKAVCEEAIEVAAQEKVKVAFDWNGIEIVAAEGDSSEQLAAHYRAEADRRGQERSKSEDRQRDAAEQQSRLAELQQTVDGMIADLDEVVGVQAKLVAWVGRFSQLNDHIDLRVDWTDLAAKLEAAGYTDSAEAEKTLEEIRADKATMARYIIGQAIKDLRQGMPVHPICSRDAADYAAVV